MIDKAEWILSVFFNITLQKISIQKKKTKNQQNKTKPKQQTTQPKIHPVFPSRNKIKTNKHTKNKQTNKQVPEVGSYKTISYEIKM